MASRFRRRAIIEISLPFDAKPFGTEGLHAPLTHRRQSSPPSVFRRDRHWTACHSVALFFCARWPGPGRARPALSKMRRSSIEPGIMTNASSLIDDEIKSNGWNEPWRQLKIKTELARGKHAEAIAALEERSATISGQRHACICWVTRLTGRAAAIKTPPPSWTRSSGYSRAGRAVMPRPRDWSRSGASS